MIKLIVDPSMLSPPAPLPAFKRTRRRRDDEEDQEAEDGDARSRRRSPSEDEDQRPTWAGAIGQTSAGFLSVDISFQAPSHGGVASSRYCLQMIRQWPECVPLMLVLKELLVQRGLNEPFTGGLSSYSLMLLVVTAMLQAGVQPLGHNASLIPATEVLIGQAAGSSVGDPGPSWVTVPRSGLSSKKLPITGLAARMPHAPFLSDEEAWGFLLTFFLDFFGRRFDPMRHAVSVLRGVDGIIPLAPPTQPDEIMSWAAPLVEVRCHFSIPAYRAK